MTWEGECHGFDGKPGFPQADGGLWPDHYRDGLPHAGSSGIAAALYLAGIRPCTAFSGAARLPGLLDPFARRHAAFGARCPSPPDTAVGMEGRERHTDDPLNAAG